MKRDFPSVKICDKKAIFKDGKFCSLPMEYQKESTLKTLNDFYKKLLENESDDLQVGEDPIGFTYFKLGFICYVGIVCNTSSRSKFTTLKKKYPKNRFFKEYIEKRIKEEHRFINQSEYIPIDVVAQNLHEIRGLNAKVTDNIDALMEFDNEENWEQQFDKANLNLKKIYVASRLTKFILDNTKFYNPQFWETLILNTDRYFNPHRCISKIVKIYRNDFKKEKPDIEFSGSCFRKLQGDKEYFEILIKIFIENALKYSFIKTIGPKIAIAEHNNSLLIEIKSYGKLIPDDDKKHIFVKGFRSSVNRSRIDGTGMGLFNAKKLIELFHGQVEVSTQRLNDDSSELELGWNIFTIKFDKTFTSNKTAFLK